MPYTLFHQRCPGIAEKEARSITVFQDQSPDLPAGTYFFLEMFCDEKGCDCRRVFFHVETAPRHELKAVIAWGWENAAFYAKWMGDASPETLKELRGPVLNLASPQSDLAPALLKLAEELLLKDAAFVERVKRHYELFRGSIKTRSRR